jgi:hypothetical protein
MAQAQFGHTLMGFSADIVAACLNVNPMAISGLTVFSGQYS